MPVGDTEGTVDGRCAGLDTYTEPWLFALEALLTRESDAESTQAVLKFILLHSPGNETLGADIGHWHLTLGAIKARLKKK